jgi:hypothetical protein
MPGVRKRIACDTDASAGKSRGSREAASGGVRQRIGGARVAQASLGGSARTTSSGVKSRMACCDTVESQPTPFNDCMRKNWAGGKLSSPQVVEFCYKAAQQGATNCGKLAKHSDPKNAHRDIVRALGWPVDATEISWIEVNGKPHPICCPIKHFEKLAEDDHKFTKKFGSPGAIKDFWAGLGAHTIYESNKTLIDVNCSSPGFFHADGAPTTKHDGLFTISYGSVLAEGSTKSSRNVFTVVKKSF